jgi:copper homeostasis protein
LYSEIEFETIKEDILAMKRTAADGVVFGLLNANGTIDLTRTRELVELAKPMNVTFHRAFDVSRDLKESLRDLIQIDGIQRILTRYTMRSSSLS